MSLEQKYPREVKQILAKYPPEGRRSAVMPLLYLAQQDAGYITREAMQDIAGIDVKHMEHPARRSARADEQRHHERKNDAECDGLEQCDHRASFPIPYATNLRLAVP